MNAREWIEAFARRLEVAPPSPEEFARILDLAAEAAHGSERVAAPVACWVGARAGRPLEESIVVAREVTASGEGDSS